MRIRLTSGLLCAVLIVPLLVLGAGTAGGQAPPAATITVVHGLRGQLVDVYLDDQQVLKGYEPERVTDPIPITPGDHRVALRPAGSAPSSAPMAAGVMPVKPGANVSIVAHFDQNGLPSVSSFDNNIAQLPSGKARLVARNTAAVQPVSVVVAGLPPVNDLAIDREFGADVAPATYQVTVKGQGGETIVPPNNVPVPEGAATIMYLIGSRADNNLIWIGQSIKGLAPAPTIVKTGNSGLAAPDAGGLPTASWWLAGAGFLVAVGAISTLMRRRFA